MEKLIAATMNGERVYGKFIGTFVEIIDHAPFYYPGWVPDYEEFWYDAMRLIDGRVVAIDGSINALIAFEPGKDFMFIEDQGEIAYNICGHKKRKCGKHSNSSNRKANRKRIADAQPLPF